MNDPVLDHAVRWSNNILVECMSNFGNKLTKPKREMMRQILRNLQDVLGPDENDRVREGSFWLENSTNHVVMVTKSDHKEETVSLDGMVTPIVVGDFLDQFTPFRFKAGQKWINNSTGETLTVHGESEDSKEFKNPIRGNVWDGERVIPMATIVREFYLDASSK